MTTSGRSYRRPWRVAWYFREGGSGRPVGGGHRAFALEQRALTFAAARRTEGYHAEEWCADSLPGVP